MDKIKNLKMSTLITVSVVIISCLGMGWLYIQLERDISKVMKQNAINTMMTALDGQSNVTSEYVAGAERTLKEYSSAAEIKNVIENPDNAEYVNQAKEYTTKFFQHLNNWEGIYISDWNTKVLVHSSPDKVGMVTRKGDELKQYQQTMLNGDNGFFDGGVYWSSFFVTLCSINI